MNPLFVVLIGMGIVFIGLICIVLLCNIMNILYDMYELQAKNKSAEKTVSPAQKAPAASPVKSADIPNRQELIAAVSAAIAEEEGTDLSAIRILSVKPL